MQKDRCQFARGPSTHGESRFRSSMQHIEFQQVGTHVLGRAFKEQKFDNVLKDAVHLIRRKSVTKDIQYLLHSVKIADNVLADS